MRPARMTSNEKFRHKTARLKKQNRIAQIRSLVPESDHLTQDQLLQRAIEMLTLSPRNETPQKIPWAKVFYKHLPGSIQNIVEDELIFEGANGSNVRIYKEAEYNNIKSMRKKKLRRL
jgi:uncharacterized protein involved in exopolysaccharide biosynthesis